MRLMIQVMLTGQGQMSKIAPKLKNGSYILDAISQTDFYSYLVARHNLVMRI